MKNMYLGVFQVFGSPSKRGILSWQHPRSDVLRFHEVDYWVDIARLLDRSGFDFLFFADGYGYPELDGDLLPDAARYGVNLPLLDPQLLIPVLARETSGLGLVVTETTGDHHPVETARRFATLDHMTGGRLGMNVVTGTAQNAVANLFGHESMVAHDTRYDVADEYLELARLYWERSWETDAVVADVAGVRYIDPDKLHRVEFAGEHYRSSGYLPVDPSPQRTPVIFQAGTSERGRAFAARNAECVLIQGTSYEYTARNVADIRRRAAEAGRDPDSIRILVTATITVAPTTEEARAIRDSFERDQRDEVTAAMYVGNTGINLLDLDPERPLSQITEDATVGQMGQSNIDRFRAASGQAEPTVGQILDQLRGRGVRGFQITGSTSEVVDELERMLDATDLDGILLDPIFGRPDMEDFATLAIPELRRRGRIGDRPSGSTLRDRLFG